MAEKKQEARRVSSNLQQFLQHALNCSNPSCILPHCVNTKLKLQHSRGCKKRSCTICQEVRSMASKHSESCVDYNCRIPFCMEAKLDTHERAQLNLSKCLDGTVDNDQCAVGSASIGRAIAMTARPQGCLESLNNSHDRESAPNLTLATPPPSPSVSRLGLSMYSYPPMTANSTHNNPASFHNITASTNSPHHCLSKNNAFKSKINSVASDSASSPWHGFVKPLPAYHDSTLTTNTQERTTWPSLATGKQNTAANTHVTTDLSSLSLHIRQQNDAVGVRVSQNTNKQIHKSTDQLPETTCFSTQVEACHSSPLSMGIGLSGSLAKVKRARNTRALVKARLVDTLYDILQLIKRTSSTEELLMCIRSLSIALGELIKKS